MGGNHGGWRGDVQRDGMRRDTTVHVRIRWVMAMRTRLGAGGRVVVVVGRRGRARQLLALWRRPSSRDGHIRSAIGIS
jgi:hypothetical protein